MDPLLVALLAIFTAILFVILGGVFAEPIVRLIHRRIPHFSYDSELLLMWGVLVLAAFATGMVVMYMLR